MKPFTKSFAFLLGIAFAASLHAQNWPLPANTPNTPVNCSASCPQSYVGKPTYGWSDPVIAFTGRFLDSAYEQDWQQYFRTGRAGRMRSNPQGTRIYFAFGQAVSAYDANTFFTRLEAHEPLVDATQIPTNPSNAGAHPAPFERYLNFDQFFYAENGSGWLTPPADGQDRLFDFDIDDRGIVYMAYSMFGWGMAKDSGTSTGGLMEPSYQDTTSLDFSPRRIMWVKSSSGSYYAFVGKPSNPTLVFNVDDWQHPLPRGQFQEGYVDYARGGNRTAVLNDAGELKIYDNDTLINGGQPLVRQTASPGYSAYVSVIFDGTNFWAGAYVGATYAGILSKYAPNGSGGYTRTDYPLSGQNDMCQVLSMRYRDGYIGLGVQTVGGTDQRLYNITSGNPTEIPLNGVFLKMYSTPPQGYIRAPRAVPGILFPWVKSGKLYVVIPATGLGDVWQLRNDSSLGVTIQGTAGGVNPNAPARDAGDIFYGDKIGFIASTSASAQKPVQWNFGTTKDPFNTAQGSTGATTYHQYSGLAPSDLAAPLTVTATDTTTGTSGTASLQMKAPKVAFGFGNSISKYKYLFTQGNASSPAPIVADDTFFDASDGDLVGHFDEWRIDSTASQFTAATGTVPVGTCGTHTLTYIGHYGAYSSMTPSNPDFAVTLQPTNGTTTFTYTVQPFAPSVDFSSNGTNLVFTSSSRSAAALANTAVTYKWDIVNASDTVVFAGPAQGSASSLATIPSFPVPLSTFNLAGLRAKLTVGMADVSSVCASGTASQTAYSVALPTIPDAVLGTPTSQTTTGATWSVSSPSGAMTRDAWTFSWSALDSTGARTLASSEVSPVSSTTSSYAPVFSKAGTYKVQVKVTNAIGSVTLTSNTYTTTANASTCSTMIADNNVFIDGSGQNCRTSSGTCSNTDAVTFVVTFWNGYNSSCATHTYSWSIDGANAGTSQSIVKTFTAGSHTVSCTVNNGSQSVQLSQTFSITTGVVQPPPPPPGGNTCGTLVPNSNVFMSFSGPISGCSDRAGTCSTSEAISFGINFWAGYNQTCATHSFSWRFDDGTTAAGQSISKSLSAGTHIVTCTVSNGSQAVDVSSTVTVAGSVQPPPPVGNQCGTLTANSNVFLSYAGPVSHCHDSGNCSSGEAIAFTVTYWQFTPSTAAGCTPSYSWQFDDGGTGTGQSLSHTFTTTGQHTATCTITYGTQTLPLTTTVNVIGNPAIPAPEVTVGVEFLGANTYRFTPFVKSGTVTKFVWDFGDGGGATTNDAKPVTNTYLKSGKYTVVLTAQSNGPSGVVTLQVTVGTSRPRAVRHS